MHLGLETSVKVSMNRCHGSHHVISVRTLAKDIVNRMHIHRRYLYRDMSLRNVGKSQANYDKAMIMRGYVMKDKDFHKITLHSFNGRSTDTLLAKKVVTPTGPTLAK